MSNISSQKKVIIVRGISPRAQSQPNKFGVYTPIVNFAGKKMNYKCRNKTKIEGGVYSFIVHSFTIFSYNLILILASFLVEHH